MRLTLAADGWWMAWVVLCVCTWASGQPPPPPKLHGTSSFDSGQRTFTSGDVISITANAPTFGGSRPNVAGDPHLPNPTIDMWLNRSAFADIPAFTFGNGPRNLPRTRTDGLSQFEVS